MNLSASCLTAAPAARAFFRSSLKGFRLVYYPSAGAFLKKPPSGGLVIIDSALPDMAGGDLVSALRGDTRTSALLLVLTGRAPCPPAAAAALFDSGADEYFPFPPDAALFRARCLNLLARSVARAGEPAKPVEYSFGPLRISPEARTASVAGADAGLTALEFDILLFFLRNQGRVVSRYVLMERVWKPEMESGPRAVDKRIEALRRKLGRFGGKISTVFGLGYMLKL